MFSDQKNKNIIITGGLGFLGRQIIDAFYEQGSKIIILDNKKKIIQKNLNTSLVIFAMKKA